MDSIKGQGGIQMLLTAEQEAQQIVSSARNLKMTRLKQAKDKAEKASLYRARMESEYQGKLSVTSGNSGLTVKRLEEETQIKIQGLKQASSKISHDVVKMLLGHVKMPKT